METKVNLPQTLRMKTIRAQSKIKTKKQTLQSISRNRIEKSHWSIFILCMMSWICSNLWH